MSFSLINSLEIGSNSTPTSLAANMCSSHNLVFFPQNNTKSSMLPLILRATPTHRSNLSFRNMPKALQYQLNLPPSKSIQTSLLSYIEIRISSSLKLRKSMLFIKQVLCRPMPLSFTAFKLISPGMIKPSSTDSMMDSVIM